MISFNMNALDADRERTQRRPAGVDLRVRITWIRRLDRRQRSDDLAAVDVELGMCSDDQAARDRRGGGTEITDGLLCWVHSPAHETRAGDSTNNCPWMGTERLCIKRPDAYVAEALVTVSHPTPLLDCASFLCSLSLRVLILPAVSTVSGCPVLLRPAGSWLQPSLYAYVLICLKRGSSSTAAHAGFNIYAVYGGKHLKYRTHGLYENLRFCDAGISIFSGVENIHF